MTSRETINKRFFEQEKKAKRFMQRNHGLSMQSIRLMDKYKLNWTGLTSNFAVQTVVNIIIRMKHKETFAENNTKFTKYRINE